MTNLKCSVSNCINNKQSMCTRHDINVDGRMAHSVPETCCSSFGFKEGNFQNAIGNEQAFPQTEVKCNAKNCVYNANSDCTATEINVSGSGASDRHDTECDTFACK